MNQQTFRVLLAIIILAAISAIYSSGCSRIPDNTLYMPQKPTDDFLQACKRFQELKSKNRLDESIPITLFFQKCQDERGREKKEGYIPITQKILVNLIGEPDTPPFKGQQEWFYYTHFKPNGTTGNMALFFKFSNGYLTTCGAGAGD